MHSGSWQLNSYRSDAEDSFAGSRIQFPRLGIDQTRGPIGRQMERVMISERSLDDSVSNMLHPCDALFQNFHDAVKELSSSFCILPLLEKFVKFCDDALKQLRSSHFRVAISEQESRSLSEIENHLLKERAVWRLLRLLIGEQMDLERPSCPTEFRVDESTLLAMKATLDDTGLDADLQSLEYASEKMYVHHRFLVDADVRKAHNIVKWLEEWKKIASPEIENELRYFANAGVLWESTLVYLKALKASNEIISEMDPDAPSRQKKTPLAQDLDDQKKLTGLLVHFLRTGELTLYEKLCHYVGQPWRMSVLLGSEYCHDPNYYNVDSTILLPVEGNPSRVGWKAATFAAAEDVKVFEGDRLLCAIASGHLHEVLGFVTNWEDAVWSYFRCLQDQILEKEIEENVCSESADFQLPSAYWKNNFSAKSIFAEIEASPKLQIREEAADPMRLLMKAFILNDAESFACLQKFSDLAQDAQMKRFLAHLAILLKSTGMGSFVDRAFIDAALADYLEVLVSHGSVDQVLFYITAMSTEQRKEDALSQFMKKFCGGSESRQLLIRSAEQLGLDGREAARRVVEETRRDCRAEAGVDSLLQRQAPAVDFLRVFVGLKVVEKDLERISALDWIIMEDDDPLRAAKEVNALARCFLLQKNVRAAKLSLDKLALSAAECLSPRTRGTGTMDNTAVIICEEENHLRESEALQLLIVAFDEYEAWSHTVNVVVGPTPAEDNYDKYSTHKHAILDVLRRIVNFRFGWLEDRVSDDDNNNAETDGAGDEEEEEEDEDAKTRKAELVAVKKVYFPVVLRMFTEVLSKQYPGVEASNKNEALKNCDVMWDIAISFLHVNDLFQYVSLENLDAFKSSLISKAVEVGNLNCGFFGFGEDVEAELFDWQSKQKEDGDEDAMEL
ncbi:unnamed protein product [Notodromas monacha]|uniref:Nuclear pore complex protein n=1 Tax=Notodromas monacha TaxID=399045 RepID=A0A7R9GJD4_9CRUS|nr:unnamed protein product [Notodromas monacha]CAG0922734.1 unnamed protein product [Notodromas monacha]